MKTLKVLISCAVTAQLNRTTNLHLCFHICKKKKKRFSHDAAFIWAATWENRIFAYAKTKTQISFAVTAKLISVFVFATRIVQSLFLLSPKFQVSSHLQWLPSPICVTPGRKPRRPVFWRRGSFSYLKIWHCQHMSLILRNRSSGFHTKSGTSLAGQSLKMASDLKFRI